MKELERFLKHHGDGHGIVRDRILLEFWGLKNVMGIVGMALWLRALVITVRDCRNQFLLLRWWLTTIYNSSSSTQGQYSSVLSGLDGHCTDVT